MWLWCWVQNWGPTERRDLLQSMPAGTATEVTLQLLLQDSHKWVYNPPRTSRPRPTSTSLMPSHADLDKPDVAGIAEDNVSGGAAELAQHADISADETLEEEYDEEEVRSQV
jgi:hypothetical protein